MTGFDETHTDSARALAMELDHLPLALAQAAAYIRRQRTELYVYTFTDYLREYQARYARLLEQKQIQPSLNRREAIVMTTWDATMHKLSADARHIFYYAAYMSSFGILKALFNDLEKYEDAIKELATYSMIKVNEEENEISIHNLVQKVSQLKQEKEGFDASLHIEYVLSSLYKYWQKMEKSYLTDEDTNKAQRAYSHYLLLDGHITCVYQHVQHLQKENVFGKKRKRVFSSKDRFMNVKIANYGLKLLINQAVLDQREEAFYDMFATPSQQADLIDILKEALDEEEVVLAEVDYQEIIELLP